MSVSFFSSLLDRVWGGTRFEVSIDSAARNWIVMAFLGSCFGKSKVAEQEAIVRPKVRYVRRCGTAFIAGSYLTLSPTGPYVYSTILSFPAAALLVRIDLHLARILPARRVSKRKATSRVPTRTSVTHLLPLSSLSI